MDDDVAAITAGLTDLENTTEAVKIAERHLAAGDAAFAADLGIALWHAYGREVRPPWQYGSVLDHLVRLLTLTPAAADEALRLIGVTVDRRGARYVASLLASAHEPRTLDGFFDRGSEELRVCLLHELALRGIQVRHPWAVSRAWRHHPLAWLPPALTPLEGTPSLPHYSLSGSSGALPEITPEPIHGRGDGRVPGVRETTTPDRAAALGSAVAGWAEHSHGCIEARTFAVEGALGHDAIADTLLGLGLEAVPGPGIEVGSCTAADAWGQLFLAASGGGAYGRAEYGAYGRLLAWRSIAALSGAAPGSSPAGIETSAGQCSWYSFARGTTWFNDVAWDVGLVAVHRERRHLAVLAATDTD